MKQLFLTFGLLSPALLASEVGVPSIPGIQLSNPYGELNPIYDHMLLDIRLDYRCVFKNNTVKMLTF